MASRRDRPRPAQDARRVGWRGFAAAPGLAAPAADAAGRAARAAATRAAAAHPAHRGRGRVEPACESYLFWRAALARHRRAARLPGPRARAAARPPLSRHGGRLWSVLAARWALLCRRAPELLQLGRGGPIALRGGTLAGLPLGLELVAPARRPAAATGYRSARADHTRGDPASRPGSASGHARALPRRGTGRRDRRLSARQRRPAARSRSRFRQALAHRHRPGSADADARGREPHAGARRRLPAFPVARRPRIAAAAPRRVRQMAAPDRAQRRRLHLRPHRRRIWATSRDLTDTTAQPDTKSRRPLA